MKVLAKVARVVKIIGYTAFSLYWILRLVLLLVGIPI